MNREIQDLELKKNSLNFENTNLREKLTSKSEEFDKLQKTLHQIQIDNSKNLNDMRNDIQNKARSDYVDFPFILPFLIELLGNKVQ